MSRIEPSASEEKRAWNKQLRKNGLTLINVRPDDPDSRRKTCYICGEQHDSGTHYNHYPRAGVDKCGNPYTTPGREINAALSRATRTSLDQPVTSHDPNQGESGDQHSDFIVGCNSSLAPSGVGQNLNDMMDEVWKEAFEPEVETIEQKMDDDGEKRMDDIKVPAQLKDEPDETKKRKRSRLLHKFDLDRLTPHLKELVSIFKLQQATKPDGTGYSGAEIAKRLHITISTYWRRVAELKLMMRHPRFRRAASQATSWLLPDALVSARNKWNPSQTAPRALGNPKSRRENTNELDVSQVTTQDIQITQASRCRCTVWHL